MSKILYDLQSGVPGVRLATQADEMEIFGLLLLLHAENAMFSLNREKTLAGIRYATERKGGIIYCIEEDKRVVASLGMLIMSDWYSDDLYLMERWNFVHPEYRRSDYARKLLEQAKWASEWFKTRPGITSMPFMCSINSFERTEAKVRLYARHMPCLGAFFMYGVPPRQSDQVREEMRRIEEANRKASKERSREVRPVVETIIRATRHFEEADHGR